MEPVLSTQGYRNSFIFITFENAYTLCFMKKMLLLFLFFTYSLSFGMVKDSINYHEIKDAMVCFDCINRNQEMLRQVISNLERLDSTVITVGSRGSYYFDLSMAFSLLTEAGGDYLQVAKIFSSKAIHFAPYPAHYLHAAKLFQREQKCDSMEICIKHYLEVFPTSESIYLKELGQMRNSCNAGLKR